MIVDAKDENARRFYERESVLPFPDQPMKLFRPIADIWRLFDGKFPIAVGTPSTGRPYRNPES